MFHFNFVFQADFLQTSFILARKAVDNLHGFVDVRVSCYWLIFLLCHIWY